LYYFKQLGRAGGSIVSGRFLCFVSLSPQRNEKKKRNVKRNFVQPSLFSLSIHYLKKRHPDRKGVIPFAKA
jgi:hypothetical protein